MAKSLIPNRKYYEKQYNAKIITYVSQFGSDKRERPGGQCGCCGASPSMHEDDTPNYIYRAGICDSDGVYYSMLCGYCLEDLRHDAAKRKETNRDVQAGVVTQLLGDDLDGAQAMMEDMEWDFGVED